MTSSPSFQEFRARAAGGVDLVPVWREVLFDVDTAVTAFAKLSRPPFAFLLESVLGGERWARYTFLGTEPSGAWRLREGRVSVWAPGSGWSPVETDDPLADLDARLRERRVAEGPGLPRFVGGAVGYFGYDVVRQVERLPSPPPDDLGVADALFLFTDVVVAVDNLLGRARVIALAPVAGADEAGLRARYDEAVEKVDATVRRLHTAEPPPPLELAAPLEPSGPLDGASGPGGAAPFRSTFSREAFEAAVERIREYIHAGDAFQVVLSQRLDVPLEAEPYALYRALRTLNPSPYLYYLELDGLVLVGSSPEVLVRVERGRLTVRPIAGTRPRGRTPEEDRAMEEELRADEKELAEHRMLVDLGRNDVGRVARYGSVTVPERMVVERYSHVMHLVSQVEGELREGLTAMDALRACFPAGTVTGAPKVRAMEIIDELEPVGRGPYAGAVGYIAYGGATMDTAITIRTVVVAGGRAYVQAGAGVVADSDPAREYEETLSKAGALLSAARMAGGEEPGA